MSNSEWERVDKDTERKMIFGGWLVKHREVFLMQKSQVYYGGKEIPTGVNMCMTFVPDVLHEWEL